MNTFFIRLEELWVAVAFAEAGAYDALQENLQVRCTDSLHVHAI